MQTLTEKLLARASSRERVKPGEIVVIEPDVVLSHDNTAAISAIFKQLPHKRVRYPDRLAVTLDHAVPPPTAGHARNHARIRDFVREHGIGNFFEAGRGICHQVLCEEGVIGPGMALLGADSHSTHYGWLGAFSAGIGRSEVAALWATGQLWLRVPETIQITLAGKLRAGVTAKDLDDRHDWPAVIRWRELHGGRIRRAWPCQSIARFARCADQYDGGNGRQECLHRARRRNLALAGRDAEADAPA